MSHGFLLMMLTVFSSVGVYYLWAFKLGLNENIGLIASTLTAVMVSFLFFRFRKR